MVIEQQAQLGKQYLLGSSVKEHWRAHGRDDCRVLTGKAEFCLPSAWKKQSRVAESKKSATSQNCMKTEGSYPHTSCQAQYEPVELSGGKLSYGLLWCI